MTTHIECLLNRSKSRAITLVEILRRNSLSGDDAIYIVNVRLQELTGNFAQNDILYLKFCSYWYFRYVFLSDAYTSKS